MQKNHIFDNYNYSTIEMKQEIKENDIVASTISTDNYNKICNKVFDYMLAYTDDDLTVQQNFALKREHINRVIGYTEVLTRPLNLDEELVLTAQLIALLHDIGRFEQFKNHKTFNDALSFDHAEMSVQIIDQNEWLTDLPEELQLTIKKAILNHNKIAIPKNETEEVVLLSKIIRDADKTDILDIAVKEYALPVKNQNLHFSLELNKPLSFTKSIASSIISGKLVDKKELKTITDFKLFLMAFVYDINFKKTFATINERQYLKRIFDTLPKSDDIFEVYRTTKIHVENQLIR